MYSSEHENKIYQENPVFHKPSIYRPSGWTETVEGYIREARKLTTLILRNRKLTGEPYTWFLTIAVETVIPPKDTAALWTRAARSMKDAGIVAVWVREPTTTGGIHYHMLLRTRITKPDLRAVFQAAMKPKKTDPAGVAWHMNVQPVDDDDWWWLAHYVTKARIAGTVNGKSVADFYASKRLLFVPGLPFNKHGVIGKFWAKPKGQMWADVIATERKIADGLKKPHVERLAKHVYDFLGGTIPLKQIERAFGFQANGKAVKTWIKGLLAGEWAVVGGE